MDKIQERNSSLWADPDSLREARYEVHDIAEIGRGLAVSEGTVAQYVLEDMFSVKGINLDKNPNLCDAAHVACKKNYIFLTAYPTAKELVDKYGAKNFEYVEFLQMRLLAGIAVDQENKALYDYLRGYRGIADAVRSLDPLKLERTGIQLLPLDDGYSGEAMPIVSARSDFQAKEVWTHRLRALWGQIPRDDVPRRTALAIIQGAVERSNGPSVQHAGSWLFEAEAKLKGGRCPNPLEIEATLRGLNCGLQMLDSERDPDSIFTVFGVVQSIEDGVADISLYLREALGNPEAPVLEAVEVPEVDLPTAYARRGVWVAWVERQYKCGSSTLSKGRFEPGGSLPESIIASGRLSYQSVPLLSEDKNVRS